MVVVTAVALLGLPRQTAVAAEDPESLIRQGNDLRRKGDDVRAHGYFKRAYEISQTPRSTAQLGLSFHSIGQHASAEALLSEALATDDPWVQSQRAALEKARKAVRAHLGAISVVGAPADATVALSAHKPSRLAPDGVVWVAPGEVTLRIESAGHEPMVRKLSLNAGERATLPFDAPVLPPPPRAETVRLKSPAMLPAATAPEPTPEDVGHPGRAGRITGVALAACGVAAGAAGFVMHNMASTKLATINKEAATGLLYDENSGNWKTYDRAGVGLLVGGAAAVVAGAGLFVVNWPSRGGASDKQLSLGLVSKVTGGATFQVGGRF